MKDLEELRRYLIDFAQARDWQKFHNAKNLSMALSVECAELMEHLQWLTPEQCNNLNRQTHSEIAAEIADIQMYLVLLANKLNIDILAAVSQKTVVNEQKYPVDKVKGSAKKYTHYVQKKVDS